MTGKNCLPQIMPLIIQNATLRGTHYAIVKDVTCGKNVRKGNQGDVIFDEKSDYYNHGDRFEVNPEKLGGLGKSVYLM